MIEWITVCRAVFSDPGIVPLPQHRVDFSDAHSGSGKHLRPKSANGSADTSPGGGPPEEDWTICTREEVRCRSSAQ